jgi:hypothetical protein
MNEAVRGRGHRKKEASKRKGACDNQGEVFRVLHLCVLCADANPGLPITMPASSCTVDETQFLVPMSAHTAVDGLSTGLLWLSMRYGLTNAHVDSTVAMDSSDQPSRRQFCCLGREADGPRHLPLDEYAHTLRLISFAEVEDVLEVVFALVSWNWIVVFQADS